MATILEEGTFTSGEGRNLERRGAHLVESSLPIAWRLTLFVMAYSRAMEEVIMSEGTCA